MSDDEREAPTKSRRKLRTFAELDPAAIMHPWDVQATRTLSKVPGLETLTKKVMEYGFERVFYLENIADNVRVGDKMFPRLHRLLQWGCKILGVAEPELYVNTDPVPNAYTYGHTRPFMVLTSGLVDMLDDQELLYVIGHELGHIKFGHVLYTVLARNLVVILEIIGKATLGLGQLLGFGLALPLFDWYRKAELSADRAGLLCVQDDDVPIRVLMKLAGGSTTMYAQMDQQEFLRQVRAYEEADESTLNKMYKVFLTAFRTHPFPIMRAKHIDEWIRSGAFTQLTGIRFDD
ncbi:MAG: M48 family metallopeptidase [Nannocystaceae bacterium]|nr:M48 family metallopeptidase [Nannocystaceae bacterium]